MKSSIQDISVFWLIGLSMILLTGCNNSTQQSEKLEVRIYMAWPGYQALPYYNWSELALKPNGPEPKLLEEILTLKGYSYYFVADYPYRDEGDPRIESLTDNGADVSMRAISITEGRKKLVDFSDAYFVDGLAAMVLDDSEIGNVKDLDGKRIFVFSYSLAYPWVKENLPNAILITEIDANVNPWTLQYQGLADAYINDKIGLLVIVNSVPGFRLLPEQLTQDSLGIAVRKGNPELLADINEGIQALKANGRLEEILSEYYKKR